MTPTLPALRPVALACLFAAALPPGALAQPQAQQVGLEELVTELDLQPVDALRPVGFVVLERGAVSWNKHRDVVSGRGQGMGKPPERVGQSPGFHERKQLAGRMHDVHRSGN